MSVGLTIGPDDLKGLFQSRWFCDQPGGCSDTHRTEAWFCSTSPTRMDSKGDAQPEHEALWRINTSRGQWQRRVHYLQSHQRMSPPKTVLAAGVHVVNEVSCKLSNPKSAWKRQNHRVRACNQSNNSGSDWWERVLLKTCCRNSTAMVCIIFYTRWESVSLTV